MQLATLVETILSSLAPVGFGTLLIIMALGFDVWARKRSRYVRRNQNAREATPQKI